MEQLPLLQTKLYIPPNRPELVSRQRLVERLDTGLHRKLTLVSAPAGFGKTTLVGDWVNRLRSKAANKDRPGCGAAWLSLDHDDNDPARFLAYLIASSRTIEGNLGRGALSALQSPQPPPAETVVTALINEIAALPDRIVLVLDDYHLIEAQAIHDTLTFLLWHLPPQMHVIIATREDPPLPLARLRAQGQLTELRASDLRFSFAEAAGFLNQVMGLNLSAEDISSLETRTEGWIAGLQLAAISMQGRRDTSNIIRSFTGSHRYVMDYLVEEVLEQRSGSVKAFLLQTSILDRLTGPLCDAVTGQDNGQAILELLNVLTCSSSPWTTRGGGTAITISLPICYASDSTDTIRIGSPPCTTRPANGTNGMGSRMRP
jgi:LuxR family maltose regulon positive regulatory protein